MIVQTSLQLGTIEKDRGVRASFLTVLLRIKKKDGVKP